MRSLMKSVTLCIGIILLTLPTYAVEKMTATQLIDLAKSHSAALREALVATFDAKDLKNGSA